ncbi:TetR family transcriptional regulator [Nocardioides sp. J9]|uniref:TetR/AcrR family transcriptional regulator n=1 Tax=Nocardioides sp. J9 TaxID=935844 RepID=UPI0011A599A2|nr:TetR/AcrR family transcriptional regulator [Nocardioides sp. J9]TWG94934.1 TetR family transcriptional regulator [Nocardioides sp. J9]
MNTPTRPFRGVSAAERTATRRDQLLEGLLDVVLAEGSARTTVNKVCAAAGLTKRYFYESFASLDEAMSAAATRLFDGFYNAMVALTQDSSEVTVFRAIVAATIDELDADPRAARLFAEAPGNAVVRELRARSIERFTRHLTGHITAGASASPDLELQVRVVVSGTTDVITGFLDGSVDTTREAIIETAGHLMELTSAKSGRELGSGPSARHEAPPKPG